MAEGEGAGAGAHPVPYMQPPPVVLACSCELSASPSAVMKARRAMRRECLQVAPMRHCMPRAVACHVLR